METINSIGPVIQMANTLVMFANIIVIGINLRLIFKNK